MAITSDVLNATMSAASINTSGTTATSSMNSMMGKDAFLKILMTQLKYQDPMEPMKPNEFMGQLSQLTQVEQLTNIAATLEDMKETSKSGSISQWLNVIGHQINTAGTTISTGDSVVLSPAGDYDSIVLNLTGVSDGSVTQQTIHAGDPLTLTYNGTDKVNVSAYALKDGETVGCTYAVYQTVQGIQNNSDGLVAVLSNGNQHKVSTITKIIN
jgi:flagellar basal-body rod modification protein FlgD